MGTLAQTPRVTSAVIGPVGKVIVLRTFEDYCRYFGGFSPRTRLVSMPTMPPLFVRKVAAVKP